MNREFNFEPTAIGSLPYTNPKLACQIVLKYFNKIPFLPQLPRLSFYEGMLTQLIEGLPGIVVDESNHRVYLDSPPEAGELEKFYDKFIQQDFNYFAISQRHAAGFHQMLKLITEEPKDRRTKESFLKGQVTGPITFGLTLVDKDGKAVIHNETCAEIVVKLLTMKSLWLTQEISRLGLRPIIFIDEPVLAGYGSAFMPVNRETIQKQLTEVIEALHQTSALVGIHCCGNTDWAILLGLPLDIISFDAYGFLDKFALYPEQLKHFTERGGVIAWGIVPSVDLNQLPTVKEMVIRLKNGIETIARKGLNKERLLRQSLLTPSCGLGGLAEPEAESRLGLLKELGYQAFNGDKVILEVL